jgi:hypothetical protein
MDDSEFQQIVDNLDEQKRAELRETIKYVAQCFDPQSPCAGVLIVGNHETRKVLTISLQMDPQEAFVLLSYVLRNIIDDIETAIDTPMEKKH